MDPPDDRTVVDAARLRWGFAAESKSDHGAVVLRLHGELDMATAPILARSLRSTVAANPRAITLDLSELTFMDLTGMGAIVNAWHQLAGTCPFVLRSPRPAVLRTFRITGMDRLINIAVDVPAV